MSEKEKTQVVKQELIGSTEIVHKRNEKVNKVFEEIFKEIKFVENVVSENSESILRHDLNFKNVMSDDESTVSSLIELYNLLLYSLTVEDLEEAIIQMRRGLLPSNLITPEMLKIVFEKSTEKCENCLYNMNSWKEHRLLLYFTTDFALHLVKRVSF